MRDLSQRQFDAQCEKLGFVPEDSLRYYRLPAGVSVPIGDKQFCSRRAWLTYLMEQNTKQEERNFWSEPPCIP